MTIIKVRALWLEDNDSIYINDETYRVHLISPQNNGMVKLNIIDEQGYMRSLTVKDSHEIAVICDVDHLADA